MESSINSRAMVARVMSHIMAGVLVVLFSTGTVFAEKDSNGNPDQLRDIRTILANMQQQLNQMQAGVDQNADGVKGLAEQMETRTSKVSTSSNEVYEAVNSVEVTTELCFDTKLVKSLDLGGHGALGVGWSDGLEVKAIGQVDAVGNLELGMGHVTCIQVPLYSVYRPDLEIPGSEGESLHSLISAHALGSQATIGTMGFVYDQVIPAAIGAQTVFETVDLALQKDAPYEDRKKLLDIETYIPMMPPLISTAVEVAPLVALDIYLDACTHVANHPLMADVDSSYYDWICILDPNEQVLALQRVKIVVNAMYAPLWCVTHLIACVAGESPPLI